MAARVFNSGSEFDMNRHGFIPSVTIETAPDAPKEADDFSGDAFARSRRMQLRSIRYADIPALSRLYACTLTHPLLVESPTRFIDVAAQVARINRDYAESPGLGTWRADTHDGHFVGTFSLLPVDGTDDVQVGARLMPQVWGRWFAIEGGHLLCRQAFDVLGLPRLLGFCHRDHRTARSVLLRFGFHGMGEQLELVHRYELEASAWREARRLYT
ncbi:MAG TPA: GNAT family N-acetyltransferase [Rhodanobacter sp.]|nr:GNAT family N-acetyltransferase [Rhodanobacter sp.]